MSEVPLWRVQTVRPKMADSSLEMSETRCMCGLRPKMLPLRFQRAPGRISSFYRGTSLMRKRPAVGICAGPYVGPRGGLVSYERGTPVVPSPNSSGKKHYMPPRPARSARQFVNSERCHLPLGSRSHQPWGIDVSRQPCCI